MQTASDRWKPAITSLLKGEGAWTTGDQVFVVVETTSGERAKLYGDIVKDANKQAVKWRPMQSRSRPEFAEDGVFVDYPGATLTALAFDATFSGLGQWMVTLTVWLFAISTIITWSYYGEQGVVYLVGERWIRPYRTN